MRFYALLLSCSVLLAACNPIPTEPVDPGTPENPPAVPEEETVYGAIVGRVTGYNECRLQDVEISYRDQKTVSSKTGAFQFSYVALPKSGEEVEMSFKAAGYHDRTIKLTKEDFGTALKANIVENMDFYGFEVNGTVLDALGEKGVGGLRIRLGDYTVETSDDGSYSFINGTDGCKIGPSDYRIILELEDRNVEYDVLEADFSATGTVTAPTFYSGYDVHDGVKVQKVGDMFNLLPSGTKRKSEAVQGLAIDGNEMFVFHNNGGYYCYDISRMRFLYSGDVDPDDRYGLHCNESFFGTSKYSGSSEHNLLYTAECSSDFNLYIYDITQYGSTLVGKLNPPAAMPTSAYTIDPENMCLYAHNNGWVCRYRFPDFSEHTDGVYTLSESEAYDWWWFEASDMMPQGSCFHDGKLYMPCGWANLQYPNYIFVFDVSDQSLWRFPMPFLPIEPEGIDYSDGWFYVAFNKSNLEVVYRFQFPEE